jgi:hypothetical protein
VSPLPVPTARGLNLNIHLTPLHYPCFASSQRPVRASTPLVPPDDASCFSVTSAHMSTEVSQSMAAAMSRPQIGIDRLPARRVSNEPREAMNCKSCRKRKVCCGHAACPLPVANVVLQDQVQPHPPNLRGLPGLQLPMYLRYARLWNASPDLELTSTCRRRAKEKRAQDRRA